jgi:hypothetical protein
MEQEVKPKPDEPKEVRYDSSGKKVTTPPRSRETESAILAINDKLDQLLGMLSSTLPTRLGAELREAVTEAQGSQRLIEVVSKELPDRIKQDSDQIVFEKAEMLSMVISTSFQHLNDAFKSYQESTLKALEALTKANEKTSEALLKVNSLLERLHISIAEQKKEPTQPPPAPPRPEPSPFTPSSSFEKTEEKPTPPPTIPPEPEEKPTPPPPEPKKEEKLDLPGWLQAKRDDSDSSEPRKPDSPEGVS